MEPLKLRTLSSVRDRVAADLAAITSSQQATQASATHPEARSEHAKDTRSTETSYLARGLAARVEELRDAASSLAVLDATAFEAGAAIAVGALVLIEDDERRRSRYLVAPAGGGVEVEVGGESIRVVTPASPLGRALIGRDIGDEVEIRTPQGTRRCEILEIA